MQHQPVSTLKPQMLRRSHSETPQPQSEAYWQHDRSEQGCKSGAAVEVPCQFCASQSRCPAVGLIEAVSQQSPQLLFHSHSVKAGEPIFHSGDPLKAVYILKSGAVKTALLSPASHEHVIGFCMPGNTFGLDGLATGYHHASAVALETSTYCAASIEPLRRAVKRLDADWLSKLVSNEVVHEQRDMMILNHRNATARIAAFLVNLSARFCSRGYSSTEFSLSMPREDIGNHLGLAMETVSRSLSRLQDKKLIRIDRRNVTILDMDGLKRYLK